MKSKAPITNEFLDLVQQAAKASYPADENNYAFQYGYLAGFLKTIADNPKVRAEMEDCIRHLKEELKDK